jgi:thioester reductase-like protein
VLLTGATGFLGAFLLRELVRAGATVHCLVRGRDRDGARARLRANLDRYELGAELVSAPIEVVVGDLAAPGLGLTTDEHRRLADRIDGVYHAGAVVHWLHRYADMRATNVGGTVEVLRLAARRAVPVHHVSSLGVFAHRATHAGRHEVDAPTGPPGDLLTGYQRSKWVAEQTVGLARDRGLPVTVHRVARVSGDATTGACQHDDLLWRLLKGCIEVGGVPADTDLVFDLVPVDFVSAALVWLSRRPESTGGTFHLSNPVLTPLGVVVDHLREVGFVLPDLDHDKWIDLVDGDPANAAHPLLDVLRATAWDTGRIEVPLDPGSTVRALAGSGLTCPAIDERLLDVYVDHFVRTGYFPAPT